MSNIFIIHGIEGHPKENWFDWLKIELEKLEHNVFVPQFPTPKDQTLENWFEVLDDYKEYINEDSIFIGHSLGAVFILSVLEKYKLKAAFLVAGWIGFLGISLDVLNKAFVEKKFDWEKIQQNCNKFKIYNSDNDLCIKLEKTYELAEKLDLEVNLIKNAGHFNSATGYDKFNVLLKNIKGII